MGRVAVAVAENSPACTMDHLLASVTAFMQNAPSAQLPSKKDTITDKSTKVEYPGELCDLRGGCAPLLGVGCVQRRDVHESVPGGNDFLLYMQTAQDTNRWISVRWCALDLAIVVR